VQESVVNVVLILIVSLALWSMFKVYDAALDLPGTMLVVGVVAVVVVGTRRLLAARREKQEAKHE
jgi:inner membrane protein involved in colicin E2 resistance